MAETMTLAEFLRQRYGEPPRARLARQLAGLPEIPEDLSPLRTQAQAPFAAWPTLPPLNALTHQSELRNAASSRPEDAMAPVSNALSPTLGAYGMGQLLADSYGKAREGDGGGLADNARFLA